MTPSLSVRNLTPTSMAPGSPPSTLLGPTDEFQMEHGQICGLTLTGTPPGGFPPLAWGFSKLALSSTARLIKAAVPTTLGVHEYVQFARPTAGCHVCPPSVETSTPETPPPTESVAVPEMSTVVPAFTVLPGAGAVIVDTGGVVSVDWDADCSPDCRVAGCTPMSAKRLTVACCMSGSGAGVMVPSWLLSSPHAHCTVPLPKTNAPLGARYMVA